jgi:molybdopterin-binding protein
LTGFGNPVEIIEECAATRSEGSAVKLSARNVLNGTVVKVVPGAVNSEVTLRLADGIEIVSIVSKASADNLGLKPGAQAYAIIKASNVILSTD